MRGGQRSSPMRYVGCLLSNTPFMDATRRQPPHKRCQAPGPICFPTERFHFSLKSLIMTPEVEDIGVRKAFVFKGIHLQSTKCPKTDSCTSFVKGISINFLRSFAVPSFFDEEAPQIM